MSKPEPFDFWYAVNNTEVVRPPRQSLETFGATLVNYHLVTELMDQAHKVRVREGRIESFRPRIITPDSYADSMLEGFGAEAQQYVAWLREHQQELLVLQYGFAIRKMEVNDHIVSEPLAAVLGQLGQRLEERNDPLDALVVGVDEPWEVCLVKLMVEVVQRSASRNASALRADPEGAHHQVEHAFLAAARDRARIPDLARLLQRHKLFEQYQDRFFSLVQAAR